MVALPDTPEPVDLALSAQWAAFRKEVIHADAPAVQITALRDAFYAGAMSVAAIINAVGVSDDTAAAEMGAESLLSGLDRDLKAFVAELPRD